MGCCGCFQREAKVTLMTDEELAEQALRVGEAAASIQVLSEELEKAKATIRAHEKKLEDKTQFLKRANPVVPTDFLVTSRPSPYPSRNPHLVAGSSPRSIPLLILCVERWCPAPLFHLHLSPCPNSQG